MTNLEKNMMNKTKDAATYSNNASGKILLTGESAQKKFILSHILTPAETQNHQSTKIHLHDLECYNVTYNCIGLNVSNLLGDADYTFSQALRQLVREIISVTNSQSGGIGFLNFDSDMAKYIKHESDDAIAEAFRECFADLNCPLRRGSEKAYVTFNFGLDTTERGKKCSRGLLSAYAQGDFQGRPFLFPNLVFKMKQDVNIDETSPNYDLYRQALQTTASCMIPTYFNCESSSNQSTEAESIGIMGCRTRVVDNLHGPKGGIRRGNIAAVTINLVQLALTSSGEMEHFMAQLAEAMDEAKDSLLHRFEVLTHTGDFSYAYSRNLYCGAESHTPRAMLKNGTLSIGFIGLWDALSVLKGKEWNTLKTMRPFLSEAYEIIKFMRMRVDGYTKDYAMNFSLLASAAEGVCGRFAEHDQKAYGHPVSRKGYYTNSFHVPVSVESDFIEKIEFEGAFHALCSGGSISYVEFKEMPYRNFEAVGDVVKTALENDCNYVGINFPLDFCEKCGYRGRIADNCPKCKSSRIKQLRRVSGYLAESDRFTKGKSLEVADRISHI